MAMIWVVGGWASSAYGTHRQLPEFNGNAPCRSEGGIGININPGDEIGEPSNLLEGAWEAVGAGDLEGSGFSTTVNIRPGLHTYTVAVPSNNPDGPATCDVNFQVMGFAVGESFIIEGPCIIGIDQKANYTFKLVDPNTGEPEEPHGTNSPVQELFSSGAGSRVLIRRTVSPGNFVLHRVKGCEFVGLGGIVVFDVIADGIYGPPNFDFETTTELCLQFFDMGVYEIEVIARMKAPPMGSISQSKEVARRKTLLIVGPSGSGITASVPFSEENPVTQRTVPVTVSLNQPMPGVGLDRLKIGVFGEFKNGSGGHLDAHHTGEREWILEPCKRLFRTASVLYREENVEFGEIDLMAGHTSATLQVPLSAFGGVERFQVWIKVDDFASQALPAGQRLAALKNEVAVPSFRGCQVSHGQIQVRLKVRNPDFERLPENPAYVQMPSVAHGPDHLYGIPPMNGLVGDIGVQFINNQGETYAIRVSAMSLEDGGFRDIDGDWSLPHKLHEPGNMATQLGHMTGRVADIPYRIRNVITGTNLLQQFWVRQTLTDLNITIIPQAQINTFHHVADMTALEEDGLVHYHVMKLP